MGTKVKLSPLITCFSCITILLFSCQERTKSSVQPNPTITTVASLAKDSIAVYRQLLQADPAKAADSEFVRITSLQRSLVDRYGYRGIFLALGFTDTANCFPIGQFPAVCPWYALNDRTPAQFIVQNFAGARKYLAAMTDTMAKYCHFIFAERKNNNWFLHYLLDNRLFDGRRYFLLYSGGAPLRSLPENLPEGWTWPSMLRDFYKIHNGFEDRDGIRLLPANDVTIPPHSPDDAPVTSGTSKISFNDLLRVVDHGSDYEDCLSRKSGATSGNLVVEFDRDSWLVTEKRLELLPYIDFLFSRINEE